MSAMNIRGHAVCLNADKQLQMVNIALYLSETPSGVLYKTSQITPLLKFGRGTNGWAIFDATGKLEDVRCNFITYLTQTDRWSNLVTCEANIDDFIKWVKLHLHEISPNATLSTLFAAWRLGGYDA